MTGTSKGNKWLAEGSVRAGTAAGKGAGKTVKGAAKLTARAVRWIATGKVK